MHIKLGTDVSPKACYKLDQSLDLMALSSLPTPVCVFTCVGLGRGVVADVDFVRSIGLDVR